MKLEREECEARKGFFSFHSYFGRVDPKMPAGNFTSLQFCLSKLETAEMLKVLAGTSCMISTLSTGGLLACKEERGAGGGGGGGQRKRRTRRRKKITWPNKANQPVKGCFAVSLKVLGSKIVRGWHCVSSPCKINCKTTMHHSASISRVGARCS